MLYHSVYSDKIIRVLGPWWHLHIGNFFTIFLLSKLVSILINKHFWEKVELRDQLLQNKIEPRVILLVVSNYYNLGFVNAFWISVFSLCIYTCTNISHRLVHIFNKEVWRFYNGFQRYKLPSHQKCLFDNSSRTELQS